MDVLRLRHADARPGGSQRDVLPPSCSSTARRQGVWVSQESLGDRWAIVRKRARQTGHCCVCLLWMGNVPGARRESRTRRRVPHALDPVACATASSFGQADAEAVAIIHLEKRGGAFMHGP